MSADKNEKEECYSDFWLGGTSIDEYIDQDKETTTEGHLFTMDLILLAGYRRVISNFVSIATGQPIPVRYLSEGGTGFTDGKTVFLSASVKRKSDFDWCVGLALHESMHIVKSDFDVFKNLWNKIPETIYKKAKEKKITREEIAQFCKGMFNVVEDRYIDAYAFKTCPGYRGYYKSLYNKLWNSKAISAALQSKAYRLNNLESYDYRIIYLTNPSTDIDALPKLREISDMFDISRILRLNKTIERMELSFKIVEIILDSIDKRKIEPNNVGMDGTINKVKQMISKDGESEKSSSKSSDSKENQKDANENPTGDDNKNRDGSDTGSKEESVADSSDSAEDISYLIGGRPAEAEKIEKANVVSEDPRGDVSQFTESQLTKIQKHFEQTKQMLMNDFDSVKESLTSQRANILEIVEQSGIHISHAHFSPEHSSGKISKVDCIVVDTLTKSLLFSGQEIFPLSTHGDIEFQATKGNPEPNKENLEAVLKGISIGKRLGRKLQIRNETNVIKYIRRSSGKMERRILADLGTGTENVFYKIKKEQFNTAKLHISIDASSSMDCSKKWLPTMTCLSAICTACSMIQNLHVSVSLRSTHDMDSANLPYIVVVYDSEVDRPSKIRQIFPFLKPNGSTPEGLAFEAIMRDCIVKKRTNGEDHYFVNISDGEPCYSYSNKVGGFSYGGEEAVRHTRRQVNFMKSYGIKILSYFIKSDYRSFNGIGMFMGNTTDTTEKQFKSMYGKDASMIDVTQVGLIAKTMNGLFLKKI